MTEVIDIPKYYDISEEKSLPPTCPIANICQRRAKTIYYFSFYHSDKTFDEVEKFYIDIENKIHLIGADIDYFSNNEGHNFSNVCPEVNLLDSDTAKGDEGYASTAGHLTKINYKWVSEATKYAHYSNCAEFRQYTYLNNPKISIPDMDHFGIILKSKIVRLIEIKHYSSAIRQGFVLLSNVLREKFEIENRHDGHVLVGKIFGGNNRKLPDMEKSTREAYMKYLSGFYGLYRNKYAHNDVDATFREMKTIIETINNMIFDIENM